MRPERPGISKETAVSSGISTGGWDRWNSICTLDLEKETSPNAKMNIYRIEFEPLVGGLGACLTNGPE